MVQSIVSEIPLPDIVSRSGAVVMRKKVQDQVAHDLRQLKERVWTDSVIIDLQGLMKTHAWYS
jgi:hypothetical protein